MCRAIIEQPGGADVRKKYCKNDPTDYCCYLCPRREKCDISCSYLDTPKRPLSVDSSASSKIASSKIDVKMKKHQSSEIVAQIKKHQEEMRDLSVLLANGKIGEKSYLAATGTLKQEIERLKKTKENPNVPLTDATALQSGDEVDQINPIGKPTSLWYLAPFFFGIIGGLVGYVGTREEDKGMANNLLLFGVLWSVVLIIIGIVIYFSILGSIISHSSTGLALAISII